VRSSFLQNLRQTRTLRSFGKILSTLEWPVADVARVCWFALGWHAPHVHPEERSKASCKSTLLQDLEESLQALDKMIKGFAITILRTIENQPGDCAYDALDAKPLKFHLLRQRWRVCLPASGGQYYSVSHSLYLLMESLERVPAQDGKWQMSMSLPSQSEFGHQEK
jgi:hypothetical protein